MPKRVARKGLLFVDEHANLIISVMFFAMLVVAIFAAVGWNNAHQAQERLNTVEANQQAEKLGKQIADVATCFNQAKNRPRLIVILRGISVNLRMEPRRALLDLINEYEARTAKVSDCVALARKNGINPKPYLKNPPSEAGNGEGK